ncbi:MAG TPA: DUF4166 domain-containing protein [Allosphingosinicella sp.]|jgi:hypothetical protein
MTAEPGERRQSGGGAHNVIPFPAARAAARGPAGLGDLRFRALIGEAGWAALPEAVRARFGKRIENCRTAIYTGEIVECRMSRAGRVLAQAARLIGGPLPLSRDVFVPATVCVAEDAGARGQFWTRIYGRARGFPQVVHSSKRFAGQTGLEERIGAGFGIALRIEVGESALHFVSDHYFLALGRRRLRIPRWLAPGALRVSHVDCGHGNFAFVLRLVHPLLGELVCQTAMFSDPPKGEGE